MSLRAAILAALAIFGIALLGVRQFAPSVFTEARGLMDAERLDRLVARAGLWGPVLIVTLMTVAVVASPIPIALAAGAAYGHLWGTVQVVIGAELGALIAFGLARILGHDVLRRVFGDRVDAGLLGSQTALTATVFASRLMPFVSFVSFDIISCGRAQPIARLALCAGDIGWHRSGELSARPLRRRSGQWRSRAGDMGGAWPWPDHRIAAALGGDPTQNR